MFQASKMGNRIYISSRLSIIVKKNKHLPIETLFKLPAQLPAWPAGEGFASGIIDLGGLQVSQASTFTKVWCTREGGVDNLGATFFDPSSIPDGYFMLGSYGQPNNKPLSGWVLIAKDETNEPSSLGSLMPPVDYTLIWSSDSLKIKQDGVGYVWLPIPPEGYKAIGHVVTGSPEKPELDKIRCVRSDFTESGENDSWIWGPGKDFDANGFNLYRSRPRNRGVGAMGVPTGTFVAQINGNNNNNNYDLPCLKNVNGSLQAIMPNEDQIQTLIQAYSPVVYFHPDEDYLPCSVTWFFENGALLYTKGEESTPVAIDPTGSNLPQGGGEGGDEDAYWIDLPKDNASREIVKKGDLSNALAYLHVKPMFGGTFTDIAAWLFYPFNGPARAKIEFINLNLGKIGEHVGDWEHVTLRISNFNGELKSVYFSQHSKGTWIDAPELEFSGGNRPVAYSSLHGHAMYPKPGLVMQGSKRIGIRNDCGKGRNLMDVGSKFLVVESAYSGAVSGESPWLDYVGKWGPKISYNIEHELKKVERVLPGKLKQGFDKVVRSLPKEVLGEEGPLGPKMKDSWMGDERY